VVDLAVVSAGVEPSRLFVRSGAKIIEDLTGAALMYRAETIRHTYRFAGAADAAALLRTNSVVHQDHAVKDELIRTTTCQLGPALTRHGRMANWLKRSSTGRCRAGAIGARRSDLGLRAMRRARSWARWRNWPDAQDICTGPNSTASRCPA